MYLKLIDMTYPWTEDQIRSTNINVSYPRPMPDSVPGYVRVMPTTPPSYNEVTQGLEEVTPLQINGVWTQQWEVTFVSSEVAASRLAELKAEKNQQINSWRAQANQSSFTHDGKTIACDPLSRSDIDGVAGSIALTGAFPVGFPGAWKAMDNTYIVLWGIQAFKDMYASMTMQGTINFGRAQSLKASLAAATTKAEVDALVW